MTNKEEVYQLVERLNQLRQLDDRTILTNFNNQSAGGKPFEVTEIKAAVSEFREILDATSEPALMLLPRFKLTELITSINGPLTELTALHNYRFDPGQSYEGQSRRFIHYFNQNSEGYQKQRSIFWPILIDSLTLLNANDRVGQASKKLLEIQTIVDQASGLKGDIERLLQASKEEIAKKSISKHARIFNDQAGRHRTNALIWGLVSLALVLVNAGTILILYNEVKKADEFDKLQLAILSLLIISLISYSIVVSVRNYFAEKHNQIINNHKANCLGSFNTFNETATENVKDIVLQFTTQTIFSQYNPGFLNKDNGQSPSPVIELIKTVNSVNKEKTN